MSPSILDEVWESSKAKGSPLLLLLAIAKHADPDGTNAYPSLATLKRLTRLSHSTVCAILLQLEEAQHVTIQRGASPIGTNLYTVLRPWAVKASPNIGHPEAGYATGHPEIGPNQEPKKKTGRVASPDVPRPDVRTSDEPSGTTTPDDDAKTARKLDISPDSVLYPLCFPALATTEAAIPPRTLTYYGTPCPKRIPAHIDPERGQSRRIRVGKKGMCLGCYLDAHHAQQA